MPASLTLNREATQSAAARDFHSGARPLSNSKGRAASAAGRTGQPRTADQTADAVQIRCRPHALEHYRRSFRLFSAAFHRVFRGPQRQAGHAAALQGHAAHFTHFAAVLRRGQVCVCAGLTPGQRDCAQCPEPGLSRGRGRGSGGHGLCGPALLHHGAAAVLFYHAHVSGGFFLFSVPVSGRHAGHLAGDLRPEPSGRGLESCAPDHWPNLHLAGCSLSFSDDPCPKCPCNCWPCA